MTSDSASGKPSDGTEPTTGRRSGNPARRAQAQRAAAQRSAQAARPARPTQPRGITATGLPTGVAALRLLLVITAAFLIYTGMQYVSLASKPNGHLALGIASLVLCLIAAGVAFRISYRSPRLPQVVLGWCVAVEVFRLIEAGVLGSWAPLTGMLLPLAVVYQVTRPAVTQWYQVRG